MFWVAPAVSVLLWAGSQIISGQARQQANEQAAKQRKFDLETQRNTYLQEARNAEAAAKEQKLQAKGLESFATDLMRSSTGEYNVYSSEMKQQAGSVEASYGQSAVETSGTAAMFQEQNRISMGQDLDAMMESAEQEWEQAMFQREGSIISYGNYKDQASDYRSQASDIKSEIDDLQMDYNWLGF